MPQPYGYQANSAGHQTVPCIVCDAPAPTYSWTDLSGEGYCIQCGTPYQLQWGTLADGESYPRCNVRSDWIPLMRRYWSETHRSNGAGTFMFPHDYRDQLDARRRFSEWLDDHKNEYAAVLPEPSRENNGATE